MARTTASAIQVRRKRRPASKQMDLFASGRAVGTPAWHDLPRGTQCALVGLMTRLILDHALATTEAGHNRRQDRPSS